MGLTGPNPPAPTLSSPHLTISDGKAILLSSTVAPPATDSVAQGAGIIPWGIGGQVTGTTDQSPGSGSLCVVRFRGEPRPTVLLGLWLGEAHCCTVVRAYPPSEAGVSAPVDDDLGNGGASLAVAGNDAVLVTADNAFAYAFSSYAGSGMPVLVLEVHRGSFVNVTRDHLDLVRHDADQWWQLIPGGQGANPYGPGVIAPWVADECLLGNESQAWSSLNGWLTAGKLAVGQPPQWPIGTAYVAALRTFLKHHGYCALQ
jgi:hypothetical protein